MDYFSLVFTCLCLTGQGILHIAFVSRLTGKGMNIRCFVLYLLLIDSLEWFGFRFAIPGIFAIPAQLLVLYGMNRFVLRNRGEVSRVAAVLAIYISQLSFGVANSVEAVVFPYVVGKPLLYLLILLAMLASFILCICCYMAALRFLSLAEGTHTPYLDGLLFPGLFFFAAELYILHTSYSSLSLSHSLPEAGKHSALLFLQILGLAALLGTLYVYRCLCHSLQAQAALQSAAQAARVQKIYIAEARERCEQTKAFRHDIKNHLAVLKGLLDSGKPEEIKADVSLLLPGSCGIDDFDLCVIFANALDNAIQACQSVEGRKTIRIRGERQGDFYRLAFENTCRDRPLPPPGTGLSNIKAIAEKYRGTMLTEKNGTQFCLHILLNIS